MNVTIAFPGEIPAVFQQAITDNGGTVVANCVAIELPADRTPEQAFIDAAFANGWNAKITQSHIDDSATPPKLTTTEVDNPVSAVDFGKKVWQATAAKQDAWAQIQAFTKKLEGQSYEIKA